ncbi:MAG: formate dehydrogenase subunit delta [Methylophilaceae bacterium]
MKNDHLIVMANQIGDFFKSYPDQEYAQKEIATHLRKFWAPNMRNLIKEMVKKNTPELQDHVAEAIKKYL